MKILFVAEIRHNLNPWRKFAMAEKIAVAEFCHGGKISPWRKIAVAEKIAMAEKNRHGGKNRRGGRSPWRKNIAVAENLRGGKFFLYSAEFSQYTFHLIREANSLRQRNDKDDALEAKVGKISEKISVKNFGKNFRKISGKIFEKNLGVFVEIFRQILNF